MNRKQRIALVAAALTASAAATIGHHYATDTPAAATENLSTTAPDDTTTPERAGSGNNATTPPPAATPTPATGTPDTPAATPSPNTSTTAPEETATATSSPTLAAPKPAATRLFGISVPDGTDNPAAVTRAAQAAQCKPRLLLYFEEAAQPLDYKRLDRAHAQGATPVLSLETYKWKLADITAGKHDEALKTHARQLARYNSQQGGTVYLRLNHEMNGTWYPWAENARGNKKGAYAAAWRHIHNTITREGTGKTRINWVWSPNILRGAPNTSKLHTAWPGSRYVNTIGLTGYGATTYEKTPHSTFNTTLNYIRKNISKKPVIITESAAGPGKYETTWTAQLDTWWNQHSYIHAYIWFETNKTTGANNNWQYTTRPHVSQHLAWSLDNANVRC